MKHRAQVAHHSKGRLRIRVPSAKGDPEALEAIKQALTTVTGVQEVLVNESIGSITINYDPDLHDDFHEHLHGDGHHKSVVALSAPRVTEIDEIADQFEREAEFLAEHSHTAKVAFEFLHKCDLALKRATGNTVDMKVLAPLGLAIYAFVEMGIEASTPVWLTLGLFSVNHLVDLHTQHLAELQQKEEVTKRPRVRRAPVRSF
jgi:hypothetical protein